MTRVMHPKDSDGMSNSVDPDLPVRKLRIITGNVSDNFTNTPIPRIFYVLSRLDSEWHLGFIILNKMFVLY